MNEEAFHKLKNTLEESIPSILGLIHPDTHTVKAQIAQYEDTEWFKLYQLDIQSLFEIAHDQNKPHLQCSQALYCMLRNYECILKYKTSMADLFKSFSLSPNDKTLLQIVDIDRLTIFYPPIQLRIAEAVVSNNYGFLSQYGKVIGSALKIPKRNYPELIFAVWYLISTDYYSELSRSQKIDLLTTFYSTFKEPESLLQEIGRIKRSLQLHK